MQITPLAIPEVLLIEPRVFEDARGYFFEAFHAQRFRELTGLDVEFVQDNQSKSALHVLRGLHFQRPPFEQAKLVRVLKGRILDVAVDIRPGSPTYGRHVAQELSAANRHQMFVPRGFAHGFLVLEEGSEILYKCDNYYSPSHDAGLRFDDPALGIDWGLRPEDVVLSAKDQQLPFMAAL